MRTRWPWVIVGAIILAMVGAVLLSDRCYAEEHLLMVGVIGLGWLIAFVLATSKVRALLLVPPLAVCLTYRTSEFTPSVEAGAIRTMRSAALFPQNYKLVHATEGYPGAIPSVVPNCRARGFYEFKYNQEKSTASSIADRFTIVAVPVPTQVPRGLRSFTLTEGGHIFATRGDERRPATRQDQQLQ